MNKTKDNTLKIMENKGDIKIDKDFLKQRTDFNFLEIVTTGDCYICEGAFEHNTNLFNVDITAKNIVICKNAFRACPELTNVRIVTKGKATYLDEHSFGNCPKLGTVKLSSSKSVAVISEETFCPKKSDVLFCFLGKEVQLKNSDRVYRQSISKPGPFLMGTFDDKGRLFPEDNTCKFSFTMNMAEIMEMVDALPEGAIDTGLRQELDCKFVPSIKNKIRRYSAQRNPKESEARVFYR